MATLLDVLERTKSVCTFRVLVGTLILGTTCVSCDRILQLPAVASNDYLRAGVDSGTHCLIGLISWAVVVGVLPPHSCGKLCAILLCGAMSSMLDLDHFVAARSIYLGDALVLPYRPPLHSTSLVIFLFLFLLFAVHVTASRRLSPLPYMFLTASLSHQIRDASRRGVWLWPLGSTLPLPYWTYVALVCLLPVAIGLITDDRLVSKHRNGGVVDQSNA